LPVIPEIKGTEREREREREGERERGRGHKQLRTELEVLYFMV